MKTTILVAALTAGITLAAGAEARDGQGARTNMTSPSFQDLDINADGAVTMDEVEAALDAMAQARFDQTDTNGDGALSADEMMAQAEVQRQDRMANRIAARIEDADLDGDGLLQADEIAAHRDGRRGPNPDRMFNRIDTNDDGTVTPEEYELALAQFEERGSRHLRRGDN